MADYRYQARSGQRESIFPDDDGGGGADRNRDLSGSRVHDDTYRRWRDREIARFDDDYAAYRAERQQSFDQDFGAWRAARQDQGPDSSETGVSGIAGDGGADPQAVATGQTLGTAAGGAASGRSR